MALLSHRHEGRRVPRWRSPLVFLSFLVAVTAVALVAGQARASYGIFVGNELTADGSTLLGGSGDEVSGHWIEIVPRETHGPDATIEVGVTEDAAIPGELTEIPQVEETAKFIGSFYSNYEGFPPPLTNGGMNEHHVAARDIWSPSREELVEMTETPQRGPQYSDLARIAMERATSAREAVEIVGELIDEHGYSTYGGNSHFFADADEGWVMIQFAGSQGLWVAERVGSDEVRLSYPGYILEIPEDYQDDPDYMGSDNLIDFAVEQGWYDPDSDEAFNVNEVYGNQQGREEPMFRIGSHTIADFEERVREMAPISVEDMRALVRNPAISGDSTGYGQVAHIRPDVPSELGVLWVAPTSSVTTPFVPYYIGTEEIPPEFGWHRYMHKDADAVFLTEDFQHQEATEFATRTFKRLLYYTCDRPEVFLDDVQATLAGFETQTAEAMPEIEDAAATLLEAGEEELARRVLTEFTTSRANESLRLGNGLVDGLEARTRYQYGFDDPEGDDWGELDYTMIQCVHPDGPRLFE